MLLSRSAGLLPPVDLNFKLAQQVASPQSGGVDLTVTRSPGWAPVAMTFKVETSATLDVPRVPGANKRPPYGPRTLGGLDSISNGPDGVVSWRIHTTGRDRSALPIVPIDGTYRFAPGQTSVTIPVRLNPKFVPVGKLGLDVVVYRPPSHDPKIFSSVHLTIVPKPEQIPPEIVSLGRSPDAITLEFSKAMDPATIEDLSYYNVEGLEPPGTYVLVAPALVSRPLGSPVSPPSPSPPPSTPPPTASSPPPVTLKSAVYDPATRTVTLTPTAPLTQWGYKIRLGNSPTPDVPGQAPPTDGKPLTDLRGNALRINSWAPPRVGPDFVTAVRTPEHPF